MSNQKIICTSKNMRKQLTGNEIVLAFLATEEGKKKNLKNIKVIKLPHSTHQTLTNKEVLSVQKTTINNSGSKTIARANVSNKRRKNNSYKKVSENEVTKIKQILPKKRRQWKDEDMVKAVISVRKGNMSCTYASKHYNVPKTTLRTLVEKHTLTPEKAVASTLYRKSLLGDPLADDLLRSTQKKVKEKEDIANAKNHCVNHSIQETNCQENNFHMSMKLTRSEEKKVNTTLTDEITMQKKNIKRKESMLHSKHSFPTETINGKDTCTIEKTRNSTKAFADYIANTVDTKQSLKPVALICVNQKQSCHTIIAYTGRTESANEFILS